MVEQQSEAIDRSQPHVPAGPAGDDALFGRVASILEQARGNVVRAVNHNMVVAYWLIGREIVMELQRGEAKAGYGQKMVVELSRRLSRTFGKGYSIENLWKFRMFYLVYSGGSGIMSTPWTESGAVIQSPDSEPATGAPPSFSPNLTWSHYRALMRVDDSRARDYYEKEASSANWTVRELERQLHTHYYERLVATPMRSGARTGTDAPPDDMPPDAAAVPARS